MPFAALFCRAADLDAGFLFVHHGISWGSGIRRIDGILADRIKLLAANGVKIMLDNTECAGLKVLTELPVDFLRFDARYYKEDDERKTAHLDMILGYAKVQGINTTALYVDTVKEAKYLLLHGVRNMEGDVVGTPTRVPQTAIKEAKKLPVAGKS